MLYGNINKAKELENEINNLKPFEKTFENDLQTFILSKLREIKNHSVTIDNSSLIGGFKYTQNEIKEKENIINELGQKIILHFKLIKELHESKNEKRKQEILKEIEKL